MSTRNLKSIRTFSNEYRGVRSQLQKMSFYSQSNLPSIRVHITSSVIWEVWPIYLEKPSTNSSGISFQQFPFSILRFSLFLFMGLRKKRAGQVSLLSTFSFIFDPVR